MFDLHALLDSVPHAPGCYTYREKNTILYVGKAKDLRKRLSQYVQPTDQKTMAMLAKATSVEWFITPSEVEALILEARLIRQHKPHYNIDLKENQRYAYIKITDDPFPRLVTAREQAGKKSDLIGPFTDGTARAQLMTTARKLFRLRACTTMPKRVCLYYHLGQCSGPCEQKISKEAYLKDVMGARLFLQGKRPEVISKLRNDMETASNALRFEEAKRLRDAISVIEHAGRPLLSHERHFDEDVIVARQQPDHWQILVMHIHKGLVTKTTTFQLPLHQVTVMPDDFLKSYYEDNSIPDEIITEQPVQDTAIGEYLGTKKACTIITPQRGAKRSLVELAVQNLLARIDQTAVTLVQLQEDLRLPTLPKTIDAFDNSHLQGTNTVGACVRFVNGVPEKSSYQRFNIQTVTNNDVGAMQEVLTRRYKKRALPDLILIDGGKTQLMAAYDAIQQLHLTVPMISLAKREEEVYVPGLPVPLPLKRTSESSLLLQRIRNEVHRFVITHHRTKRSATQAQSGLDQIRGIGATTKFKLLRRFKTLKAIREATDEELLSVLNSAQLRALRESEAPGLQQSDQDLAAR